MFARWVRKKSEALQHDMTAHSVGQIVELGLAHHHAGRLDEAAEAYRKVLDIEPDNFDALHLLGLVEHASSRSTQAVELVAKAVSLSPMNGVALSNLGEIYRTLGRLEDARVCAERAVALQPANAPASYNLGLVLAQQGRFDKARELFGQVLALAPNDVEARWANAIARFPAATEAGRNLDDDRAALAVELDALDSWLRSNGMSDAYKAVGVLQPLMLVYHEKSNRDLMAKYGALCFRAMADWQQRQGIIPVAREAGERISVGIASAHLREHSVWNAIVKGWFKHLDKGRFELIAFHLSSICDEQTVFAESRATHLEWGQKDLREWVDTILAWAPDILIYPELGLDGMSLRLASMRLARVQMTTWGNPETSGLPSIDYYLSAQDLEPVEGSQNYTEELVLLPHLGCAYERSRITASDPALEQLGLNPDVPLLICPGTPYKYAPAHDHIFVDIARVVGPCQFVFFYASSFPHWIEVLRERLELAFDNARLAIDQYVIFLPWLPRAQYYGLLGRAAVYLDTIGFSGFNTAMQAIECGLPVVTREGRFMRGRFGSGILKRMGMGELVAQTDDGYVELAAKLVQEPTYRTEIKRRMAAAQEVLFEDTVPIRALEEFLRSVAQRDPVKAQTARTST